MKKMFLLFGLLAIVGVLFVACSEQDPTSPDETSFKKNKVSNNCTGDLLLQKEALDGAVELIMMHRPSRKGALQIVDNMARKVCATDPPNYDGALEAYYTFETHVNGQNVDKLEGGEVARQALLAMARSFATGAEYNPGFEIPPQAIDGDGGLWVITPGDIPPGGELDLVADNLEGALRVFFGSFPDDEGDITLVGYRLPDIYPPDSFDPYIPLPEIWFFDASVQPIPLNEGGAGVEVWVCVVDDPEDPDLYYRSVIAHALEEGVELLEPPIYDDSPLNCLLANYDEPVVGIAPGWLQLAGAVLRPVASVLLDVEPLNAMYFAGKGLGGRGGSLSPFAAVDVLHELSYSITGYGTLYVDEVAVAGNDPEAGGFTTRSFESPGTSIDVTASPAEGYVLESWSGCDSEVEDVCTVVMNDDKVVSATFVVAPPSEYLLTVTIEGDGTVTSDIGGIFCVPEGGEAVPVCSDWFAADDPVTLTASPDDFVDISWTEGGEPILGGCRTSCTITMDQAHDVTVTFTPDPPVLTLNVVDGATVQYGLGETDICVGSGEGGTTCYPEYEGDEEVVLESVDVPEGTFTIWTGEHCEEEDVLLATCTTIMSTDKTIGLDLQDIPG